MSNQSKNAIRETYKQARKTLSEAYQIEKSQKIALLIKEMADYQKAKTLALYHAVNGEISLDSVWESACLEGKTCYFPVLDEDKTLSFFPTTLNSPHENNKFGIPEPKIRKFALSPQEIDLIFVPLLAFDKRGTRLGMGGGFYDRTLAKVRHKKIIGVAYTFQEETYIIPDPWDVRLNAIITPDYIHWVTT
jgi:5-formyltetrahydrofolate cyclo-ligase